jgi:hypothetical protein
MADRLEFNQPFFDQWLTFFDKSALRQSLSFSPGRRPGLPSRIAAHSKRSDCLPLPLQRRHAAELVRVGHAADFNREASARPKRFPSFANLLKPPDNMPKKPVDTSSQQYHFIRIR